MRTITCLTVALFLISLSSAEIIMTQPPAETYSLGDLISIPTTIKATGEISGIFQMDLLCNGYQVNFYKNGVGLSLGEEQRMTPSLVLSKKLIGESKGTCKIKATLDDEYVLTDEFFISDQLTIDVKNSEESYNPGETTLVEGSAVKANGKDVNGFIELTLLDGNTSIIDRISTVSNSFFSIDLTFPVDLKAGTYTIKIEIYEKDSTDQKTNSGQTSFNTYINQIPTNLELILETQDVEPGTSLIVKSILHDQTGQNIESTAIVTIKDQNDKIIDQREITTDEELNFPIVYNQAPAEWTINSKSNELEADSTFKILEKAQVSVEIINDTLLINNTGNIPYNDSILVKIGEDSINIDVSLPVDKSQKYTLTAPDGEYQVEIITDGGSKLNQNVLLTGKAIDIREAGEGIGSLVRYPFVWIFIIGILGFMIVTLFKKGYKRTFIGYIRRIKPEKQKEVPLEKNSVFNTRNKAEVSLSIKGDKQSATIICLNIKNLKQISLKKSEAGNAKEIIQKIINLTEETKSVTYENQDNLFFILAPVKTKTFRNERTAIQVAQKIKSILIEYNKLAKEKIEFGIGINNGTIIAKQETDSLKFMSLGTLITTAKRVANLLEKEVFLTENVKEKLSGDIKTAKHEKNKMVLYSIKEIRDSKDNDKFIKGFLHRIEKK